MRKKTLAILLALCLALTLLPGMAMAEGSGSEDILQLSYSFDGNTWQNFTETYKDNRWSVSEKKLNLTGDYIWIKVEKGTAVPEGKRITSLDISWQCQTKHSGITAHYDIPNAELGTAVKIPLAMLGAYGGYDGVFISFSTDMDYPNGRGTYHLEEAIVGKESNNRDLSFLDGFTGTYAAEGGTAASLTIVKNEAGKYVTAISDEVTSAGAAATSEIGDIYYTVSQDGTISELPYISLGYTKHAYFDLGENTSGQKTLTARDTYNYRTSDGEKSGTISKGTVYTNTAEVQIGTTNYATLAEAITAAENDNTVKLLKDVTLNDTLRIENGKTLTLDLNGHDIEIATAGKFIRVQNANLTVMGSGKIYENTPYFGPIVVKGSTDADTANYSVVTIGKDVTLEGWAGLFIDQNKDANNYGIVATVNGTLIGKTDGTEGGEGIGMYVNGLVKHTTGNFPKISIGSAADISADGHGIYAAGYAQWDIAGAKISGGDTGIEIRAGLLNMSGDAKITGGSGPLVVKPNGNGSTTENAALAVAQHTTRLPVVVKVSGGTFTGTAAVNVTNIENNPVEDFSKVSVTLTGGTYSTDPKAYVASGYQVQPNADNSAFTVFYPYVPPVEPPVVDVPVGGGEGSVSVPVQVDKDKGEASLVVDDKKLDEIVASGEKEGTVAIDMSGLDSSVKTANLPAKTVTAINEAVQNPESKTENLSVALPAATIEFDAASLGEVAKAMKQAPEAPVAISAQQVKVSALPANQQTIVGKDALVLDLSVQVGDKKVESFGSGSVSVTVKYTPKEGADTNAIVVWFLSDDGKLTPCECKYENGKLSFTTGHFSKYVVGDFPFTDVKGGEWYYEDAVYAYVNGIIQGVSSTQFDPAGKTSRAMVVTMLWRIEGSPSSTEGVAFSDVPSDSYYAKAVAWAAEKKIVEGNGDGTFSPETAITREQLASILHRYSGKPAAGAGQLEFPDAEKVSDWAEDAILWAVTKGLIQGSDGMIMPQGVAQRCQVAAIFHRLGVK